MTNPKQPESDTEKNPWAMINPNYKFGKSLLSNGVLYRNVLFASHHLYYHVFCLLTLCFFLLIGI
jgi:hypothetical protein